MKFKDLIVPSLTFLHLFFEFSIFKVFLYPYFVEGENLFWIFIGMLQLFTLIYTGICYLSASYMDPGYLTKEIVDEMLHDPLYKPQLDDNGEVCYCYKCNMKRPLRCHHCRQCGKCVLVYDHHCSFINNCIGHRNFKAFCVFMFSWIFNAIVNLFVLIHALIYVHLGFLKLSIFAFSLVFFLAIGFFVVPQFIQQVLLMIHNSTFVDVEQNKINSEIFHKHHAIYFPRFDLGNIEMNIAERIGHSPILWFIPTPNTEKGYLFRQNPNYVPSYQLTLNKGEENDDDFFNLTPEERMKETLIRIRQTNKSVFDP